MKDYLVAVYRLFKETAVNFGRDNGSMLAASLAYYTIFAIAPLLVIAVAVAGFVFGDAAAEGQIVEAIEGSVGREGAVLIQNLIASSSESNAGLIATIISTAILILASSNLFTRLQKALNIIWGVAPPLDLGILGFLKKWVLSFGMVLVIGFILLLSIISSTVLTTLGGFITDLFPVVGPFLPRLELLLSFLILIVLFSLIFKVLPDATVAWRDVLVGGLVTAVLFSIGKILIGYYLSFSGENATYQAAGSIVILLLWVYYSSQILFFGAEFTQTYANSHGATVKPVKEGLIFRQELYQHPSTEPEPVPVSMVSEGETAVSQRNLFDKLAALLIGIATGLLLAFVSTFWSRDDEEGDSE